MYFWRRHCPAQATRPVDPIRPRLQLLEDRCVPSVDLVQVGRVLVYLEARREQRPARVRH
jgi:hypothetical protein